MTIAASIEPETITRDELAATLGTGRVQVLNVSDAPAAGSVQLVRGSLHVPLSRLEDRLHELDRARDVVVYCADAACGASRWAALYLARAGFRARRYVGGMADWIAAGLPTETAHSSAVG